MSCSVFLGGGLLAKIAVVLTLIDDVTAETLHSLMTFYTKSPFSSETSRVDVCFRCFLCCFTVERPFNQSCKDEGTWSEKTQQPKQPDDRLTPSKGRGPRGDQLQLGLRLELFVTPAAAVPEKSVLICLLQACFL